MREGFILIEFLVALALAALIIIGATSMLLVWHRQEIALSRVAIESMAIVHACSCVMRELSHAPQAYDLWKKRDKSEAIWMLQSGRDRGLCIRKGRLLFIEGSYDSALSRWHHSTQSMIGDNAQNLEFEYVVNNQRVHRVRCSFQVYNKKQSFDVYCRDHAVIAVASIL